MRAFDVRICAGPMFVPERLGWPTEAFRWLVPLPVFNTGVARHPGQAGSIPVRLRQAPREEFVRQPRAWFDSVCTTMAWEPTP